MKHLIIMIASILLGIFLFDLIAGPGEDSVYGGNTGLLERQNRYRTMQDY